MDTIQLTMPALVPVNFSELFINLAFCIVAAFMLRHLYVRRSISLSGKFHIGTVIPILALVTFLVIMVVKSSLALSLGLVGALSVVRFRTPIKEPEELVYLFLAIALGLGYGAGQIYVTTLVFVVVVVLIFFWLSRKSTTYETEYNLLVDWTGVDVSMNKIVTAVSAHVSAVELQKYNAGRAETSVFLKVNLNKIADVDAIVASVRALDEGILCSFYEARPLQ